MSIIVYDFEVFKYDTLLGVIIIDNDKETVAQTWNLDEIRQFYQLHKQDLWISWNGWNYDDKILEAIVNYKNPYELSQVIVRNTYATKCNLPINSYDLMNSGREKLSLKLTELISGKSIDTTEVDFNIDRPLTSEEKALTEKYNRSDLQQTKYNLEKFYDRLQLRLDIINEFKLPFRESLKLTDTQLAAQVLKAQADLSLKYKPKYIPKYESLRLENKQLLDFVYNRRYEQGESPTIQIGNAKIQLGIGGIHSAENQYYTPKAIYADISGYYNLLMLNYDLLPRSVSVEGKAIYRDLYLKQLEMKKTNPTKRKIFKPILLAPSGAMNNQYCQFYDPYNYVGMTTSGQLFICDLLEKVAPYVTIAQSNTDGIIIVPKDWNDEQKILSAIQEWRDRTKFTIKVEYIYNLYQRDVNYYFYQDGTGAIHTVGLKNYDMSDKAYSEGSIFNCKEPPIIAQGVVNYFINHIEPSEFVSKNRYNLKLFQYPCKKGTYDKLIYRTSSLVGGEATTRDIGGIVRAFAYNSNDEVGMVYKVGRKSGTAKVANLPDNVFLYNGDLSERMEETISKIDYNYYVERIQNKIKEFIK